MSKCDRCVTDKIKIIVMMMKINKKKGINYEKIDF